MIKITQFSPNMSSADIDRAFAQAHPPLGEQAMDAWSRAELEEQFREDYRNGDMNIHEAYELGIVDEQGVFE